MIQEIFKLPYFNGENTTRYCFNKNAEAVTLDDFLNLIQLKLFRRTITTIRNKKTRNRIF